LYPLLFEIYDDKGLECNSVLEEVEEEVVGVEMVVFVVAEILKVLDEAVFPLTVSALSVVS
jgi:hypothetical protein